MLRGISLGLAALAVACNGKVQGNLDDASLGDIDAAPVLTANADGTCDDQSQANCQEWAQSLVMNGTAYAVCASMFPPGSVQSQPPYCYFADGCAYANGFVGCHCGPGPECRASYHEVCVSDNATPTPHCVFPGNQ